MVHSIIVYFLTTLCLEPAGPHPQMWGGEQSLKGLASGHKEQQTNLFVNTERRKKSANG